MYEEIKTACLYLRYSSSNQTEQSIEGQMHVCQDFCKRHNIRIVEMYIDRATSASKDIEKRVEFLKMIKDSEKGNFNAVIVYKLDRFARSRYDSATYKYRLKRNGVQLISATENITQDPEGIILESVLEGMAEFYSAELSQKINRGMRESAMKHNSIGGAIPLGYKTVDKKLVIDETTAPIVREAFQMYADGESVAEICRTFNNRGYKTSKGTRFGKSSFTKIFRNEKYIGVYKYHDYRAEDVIPPIIDKDLWDRVQVRVGKIKKAPARNKARHTYLLTGKLFCGHCGSAMNADGNSQGYLYYRCYGKKNLDKQCNKRNMEKNLIERLVAQDAMSFLTDEYIEKIATIACDRNKQEIESDSPIPVIRDRIRQVDVSLNNLLKAIETGSAPDMLVKRMGELETEKKDMEVQLKKEMAHQVYIDKEQVIFWLEKFREGDINDEEFCQTVIDLFVNSVTVWDEPDDKFKITIAYNLTSIPQKTYRLSKDGRLSDYASNTPVFEEDDLLSAMHFLNETAAAEGKPLVLCLALGTNQGSHSGTLPVSLTLARYGNTPGVIPVCATGNEGNAAHHYYGSVSETYTPKNVEFLVSEGNRGFTLELWGQAPQLFSVGFRSPGGETIPRIPVSLNQEQRITFVLERTVIYVNYEVVQATTGSQLILIRMLDPTPGIWTLQVYRAFPSPPDFHIWLPITGFSTSDVTFLEPDPYTTLTTPSATVPVLSPSTYQAANNSFSPESGRGFTRLGEIKPDFAAPGVSVTGPGPAGSYVSFSGSSASAAITSGAAALFLQWGIQRTPARYFTAQEVKNYLIRGADRTDTITYPSREWGYGRLQLYQSFTSLMTN